MSKKKDRSQKIGKINPNEIKTRDIVHMQEFLNGVGGPHQSKKKPKVRKKNEPINYPNQEPGY